MEQNVKQEQSYQQHEQRGQSLIEYALILALVGVAFGIALAATGPAISNVFSNTVYNLLGQEPDDTREVARPADFWLTVTWVEANPLEERPLPPRDLPPPSLVPTEGPSPTATDITPTRTPLPTFTPAPSPTSEDYAFVAPFHDLADEPDWYRLQGDAFIGYDDWCFEFFPSTDMTGGATSGCNASYFGEAARSKIDFPNVEYNAWKSSGGSPLTVPYPDAANAGDNFSARFSRDIFIQNTITLSFFASSDDGVRLWLLREGETAANCFSTANGGDGTVSGGPAINGTNDFYGDGSAYPNGCLLIDDWEGQGMGSTGTVVRTIPAGSYRLQLDHYQGNGGSGLELDITVNSNPDDSRISGNPSLVPPGYTGAAGAGDCNWGQREGDNANSVAFMWEEYRGGNIPNETVCYLELRGFVTIPPSITEPMMSFWDVWELRDSGQAATWVEVAEYVPLAGSTRAVNRAALQWYRVPLRAGGTMNYNWTPNTIDLKNFQGYDSAGNLVNLDFSDKDVTFRFAMVHGTDAGTRRWYVDDIKILDRIGNDFSDQVIGLDQEYDFNDGDEVEWLYSGQWGLTANNSRPDSNPSNPSGCCAWELSPGENYNSFSESPWNPRPNAGNWDMDWYRVHQVQLMPIVSRSLSLTDMEGDEGDGILTFWHGYDFDDDFASLEVQYRSIVGGTLANPVWSDWAAIPGPDPDNPAGRLVGSPYGENTPNTRDKQTLAPVDLSLAYMRDASNNPIEYFQIRFAMLVHRRGQTDHEGWFIDNVKLHREGKSLFLDYPFSDNAEVGVDNWLATGTWWRTTEQARDGFHSFTDSPNANYQDNTGSSLSNNHLRMAHPIDFNNDTPDNLLLEREVKDEFGNVIGTVFGNSYGAPAQNPVITFWHKRLLSNDDNFHLEWRRATEDDSEWKSLWSYYYRMETRPNRSDSSTVDQEAWEFVEVDLTPVMEEVLSPGEAGYDPSNYEADDIYFRFRLYASSWGNDDGVYIDQFELKEHTESVYRLWPTVEDRTIEGQALGLGDGEAWASDGDEAEWFNKWRLGGGWTHINWAQRNGLHSFHESAYSQDNTVVQDKAPYWRSDIQVTTPADTFNILEITQIIDMRATDAADEPTMYFWSRYDMGNDDRVRVQVSRELKPADWASRGSLNEYMRRNRCNNRQQFQCYEQIYGWSQWTNTNFSLSEWSETYTWQRFQVDLSAYAGDYDNDIMGDRVRIRFVYDALDNNDSQKSDGLFIDNVTIEPLRDNVITEVASTAFFDDASNMSNWVAEGIWGLSPEVNRSASGATASLGVWRETWWDCRDCDNLGQALGANNRNRMAVGVDAMLADPDNPPLGYTSADFPSISRNVLDIAYTPRRGSPRLSGGFFPQNDMLAGQWVLETPVIGPVNGVPAGTYSFTTTSDDGVRLKVEEIDAGGTVIPSGGPEWNMINNWNDHGSMTDPSTATLEEGKRYRFTLQYYERTSDMIITLSVGGNSFSFTDSPKQGAGASFDDIPAVPYGNSSLVLDGILDLTGTSGAILQYETLYELRCGSDARVEISNDGGFNWTRNGLGNNQISPIDGSVVDTGFNGGSYSGEEIPGEDDWRTRRHNLQRYDDQQIMIRFRLDRLNESELSGDRTCNTGNANYNENGWYMSWWIVDIVVADANLDG